MPDDEYAAEWTGEIDTTDPRGATELVVKAGEKLSLQARSLLVLRKTA
jgi:glycogen operon protein